MTKKEQIYEIAKYVCNACEFGIYRACRKSQTDVKSCSLALTTAKHIYNAGYRKIDDFEAENKKLKAKLKARLTCDFVRTAQKHAVQDFAEKLRKRLTENRASNDNVVINANYEIDELLKECE